MVFCRVFIFYEGKLSLPPSQNPPHKIHLSTCAGNNTDIENTLYFIMWFAHAFSLCLLGPLFVFMSEKVLSEKEIVFKNSYGHKIIKDL